MVLGILQHVRLAQQDGHQGNAVSGGSKRVLQASQLNPGRRKVNVADLRKGGCKFEVEVWHSGVVLDAHRPPYTPQKDQQCDIRATAHHVGQHLARLDARAAHVEREANVILAASQ